MLALSCVMGIVGAGTQPAFAGGLQALSDAELDQVAAGELLMTLEDFNVFVHNNEAGFFTMDIASSAFSGAQGVFTTLQTVNSAVDLNLVVNVYLGWQQ